MSKQITFDPRHMTPEQIVAMSEQALQMQKDFAEKEEKIKETIDILFTLDDETEIQIAVNELLPFITKNIDKADLELVNDLVKVLGPKTKKVGAKKEGGSRSKTYQIFKIEHVEDKAPNLLKFLVETENFKPLQSDPTFLLVYRKRFSPAINEVAKKDGFESGKAALDELYERYLQITSDDSRDLHTLAVTDYGMREK